MQCSDSKTRFDSIPLDGCGVLHEGSQLLSFSELTRHQVLCWDRLRILYGGSDEKVPEQLHGWLFLKVHFAEYLEITDIRYGIGPNILRVKFEKMEDISKEL